MFLTSFWPVSFDQDYPGYCEILFGLLPYNAIAL